MSLIQRLVLKLSGSRADAVERESRAWRVTCPQCAAERSYWDLGGIRYKAASAGKKIGSTCPECGFRGMFPVTRSGDA